jgi:hypothetical protein
MTSRYAHYIFIKGALYIPNNVYREHKKTVLYWCVAYLPSEASIIEH